MPPHGGAADGPDATGRQIVVTGAAGGIGLDLPRGRRSEAGEIAAVVTPLVSGGAPSETGAMVPVDGGYTAA